MADKNITIKCPKCKTPLTVPGRPKRDLVVQCSECGHQGKLPRTRTGTSAKPVVLQPAKPASKKASTTDAVEPTAAPATTAGKRGSRIILPIALLALCGIGYGAFTYFQGDEIASTEVTPATPSESDSPETESVDDKDDDDVASETETAVVERPFVSRSAMFRKIRLDLEENVSQFDRVATRYLTLTHLANAGVTDEELENCREALVKLINSLSWDRELYLPEAIDAEKTIYRINTEALKWEFRTWKSIIDSNPYAFAYHDADAAQCADLTNESVSVVPADWFVYAASQPALYYTILEIPHTLEEMARKARVDLVENVEENEVIRAGFRNSDVSDYNRVIERHESLYGGFWVAYGFKGKEERQDLFRYPLGPGSSTTEFAHDSAAVIFALPNGLQGYMLADGEGRRINEVDAAIVSDPEQRHKTTLAGVSCISCHQDGIQPKTDQIGIAVRSNRDGFVHPDRILELYRDVDLMESLRKQDAVRFQESLKTLQVPRKAQQKDGLLLTAKSFSNDIDILRAAAELGLTEEELRSQIESESPVMESLGELSKPGGTIRRYDFMQYFAMVAETLELGSSVCTVNVATTYLRLRDSDGSHASSVTVASNEDTAATTGKSPASHVDFGTAAKPGHATEEATTSDATVKDLFTSTGVTFISFDGKTVKYRDSNDVAHSVQIESLSAADQEFVLKQNVAVNDLPDDLPSDSPAAETPTSTKSPAVLFSTGAATLVSFDGRQEVVIRMSNGTTKTVSIDDLNPSDIEHVLKQNVSPGRSQTVAANSPGSDLPGDLPGAPSVPGSNLPGEGKASELLWHGPDGAVLIEGALHSFDGRKGMVRIAPAPRMWHPATEPPFTGVLYVASSTPDGSVEVKIKRRLSGRTAIFGWDQISEADQQYLERIRKGLESGRFEADRPLTGIRFWMVPIDQLSAADQQRILGK